MEFRQCFQCKNDLPNTTGPEVVPCLFCGAINEAPPAFEVKYKAKPAYSMRKSSGSIDVSHIFYSNDSDSNSGGE